MAPQLAQCCGQWALERAGQQHTSRFHILPQRCTESTPLKLTGVYGAGEEGLAALANDVTYVCTLWRVGCTKGKGSAFARKQHDRRGAEGAANVSAALDAAVEVARKALRAAEAAGDGDGSGNEEGEEGAAAEQRKDAVVDDLSR